MAKIKLTKNELKNQRDALKRFQRFLPTLQLKKQQLQMEVRRAVDVYNEKKEIYEQFVTGVQGWVSMLGDTAEYEDKLQVSAFQTSTKNIAGVEVPVFEYVTFAPVSYDLFAAPLWVDHYLSAVQTQTELKLQLDILEEQTRCLEDELNTVSQRVNLFEKVKIPETKENIRQIQIYLGDQETNAVGRAKIAKQKCALRDQETAMQAAG